MRPRIRLTQLQLNCWFAIPVGRPGGTPSNLVVAVHTEAPAGHATATRAGPVYVTHWSKPVRLPKLKEAVDGTPPPGKQGNHQPDACALDQLPPRGQAGRGGGQAHR